MLPSERGAHGLSGAWDGGSPRDGAPVAGRPTSSSPRPKPRSASRKASRPSDGIWHQREDRVKAHILGCFLCYVLSKTLEQWQHRAGLGRSPRTILDELGRIQSTDIVLPMTDGRAVRLRCVVRPDLAQARLLDRLGLDLPERLRIRPPALSIGEM
jgi:hypothetical protein